LADHVAAKRPSKCNHFYFRTAHRTKTHRIKNHEPFPFNQTKPKLTKFSHNQKQMQGFRQEPGRQFKETFVNVTRLETLRLLAALAVLTGDKIYSFDIKQAYLIAEWPEEYPIWISGPEHDPTKKGYGRRLLKSLYGNKAAGRMWGKCFENVMKKFGFEVYCKEGSLFVWHDNKGNYCFCCLYVDDGNYICSSKEVKEMFEKFLIDNLPRLPCGTSVVKLMGQCTETLNLKVDQKFEKGKSSIHMSQGKYLRKVIRHDGC